MLPAMEAPVTLVAVVSVEPLIDMGRTALNVRWLNDRGTLTSRWLKQTDKPFSIAKTLNWRIDNTLSGSSHRLNDDQQLKMSVTKNAGLSTGVLFS